MTDDLTKEKEEEAGQIIIAAQNVIMEALQSHNVPVGMGLVAMSRILGSQIREGTLALGFEKRREHFNNFVGIIRNHAFIKDEESFAKPGDDGAAITDEDGNFIGMLVSPGVVTPADHLKEFIKKSDDEPPTE